MTLDYNVKEKVKIKMLDYIIEIMEFLDKVETKSSGTKSRADPLSVFVVDEDCEKLRKKKS